MCPPTRPRQPSSGASATERRRFLRLALGLTAVGAGAGGRLLCEVVQAGGREAVREPLTVLDACLGCTGCAIICPTGAIAIAPGGIAVVPERCTRCGYCASACPVAGLQVNGARGER
jgi:ferredoxin